MPALDLEQTGGLSVAALQAWVGAWLGEVYAKLGVRPMIYASPTFWANAMGDTTMFADQGYSVLWIAHWGTSSPTVPGRQLGRARLDLLAVQQLRLDVTGISGCVDLDRYNGTDLTPVAFNYTYVPAAARRAAQRPALAGIPDAEQRSGRRSDLTSRSRGRTSPAPSPPPTGTGRRWPRRTSRRRSSRRSCRPP